MGNANIDHIHPNRCSSILTVTHCQSDTLTKCMTEDTVGEVESPKGTVRETFDCVSM